jgi:hypothetical protein
VTLFDVAVLKTFVGTYWWQRRYNFAFDFTGPASAPDGVIDQADVTYLKARVGRTV